jgi:hypothetical protein
LSKRDSDDYGSFAAGCCQFVSTRSTVTIEAKERAALTMRLLAGGPGKHSRDEHKGCGRADGAIFTTIGKTPPLASFIMDISTPIGSSGRRLLCI